MTSSRANALWFSKYLHLHARSLQSCRTLRDPMDCNPSGSSVHRNSPGKNTGMGCHFLLQGIFPTQGSNPCLFCLLLWQAGSSPLVPPGKSHLHLMGGKLNYRRWVSEWVSDNRCSVMSDSLQPHALEPTRLLCLWNSPDRNTGVGCHFLLQQKMRGEHKILGTSRHGAPGTNQPLAGNLDCTQYLEKWKC